MGRIAWLTLGALGVALALTLTRPAQAGGSAPPPRWRPVLTEDFHGTALPSGWRPYEGHPGGQPDGMWKPSHVSVANDMLTLQGYRDGGQWVTGGVMNSVAAQTTYGKYEVRFRMTKGTGVKYAILLWPKSENWPVDGEIDFAEDGGGARTQTAGTVHYGTTDHAIQRTLPKVDFSQWHTVGVEWTPGKVVYTIDGRAWSTLVSSHVPHGPMDLAIQTETGTCGDPQLTCPDATTPARVDLNVDWVRVWQLL